MCVCLTRHLLQLGFAVKILCGYHVSHTCSMSLITQLLLWEFIIQKILHLAKITIYELPDADTVV